MFGWRVPASSPTTIITETGMSGRKVGVGFNHSRVLRGDDPRPDWRARYDLMRRITRMPRGKRFAWPVAASTVDVMREYARDQH